jgi:hypothetical protein
MVKCHICLHGRRHGAGAVEHLRPRRQAVEEKVIEEMARLRRGPVPLWHGVKGGEDVVSQQRVEEA